jgi:hypothetical protein
MQLAVQEHRPQLVEPLGVEQDDIQLLSYCGVKIANESTKHSSYSTTRILAVNEENLFLFNEDISTVTRQGIIKIPLADIQGVSKLKSEVQLRHEGRLLRVSLYGRNIYDVDQEKTQDLFEILVDSGIPTYVATDIRFSYDGSPYQRDLYRPNRNQWIRQPRISDRLITGTNNNGSNSSGNNTYIKY